MLQQRILMGSKYRPVVATAGQVIRSRGTSETIKWVEQLTDQSNSWENTKVEIGILGESHRGKSTFINTIRGLKPGDPESAEVDYKECTTDVKSYIFPNNPNIKLIDCPGVGTDKFKRETYHQQIDFTRYWFVFFY